MLLKNRPTTVTQKLTNICYSKIGPQTLLKNWSTTFTQKFTHKHYSKSDTQMLLKKCIQKM